VYCTWGQSRVVARSPCLVALTTPSKSRKTFAVRNRFDSDYDNDDDNDKTFDENDILIA